METNDGYWEDGYWKGKLKDGYPLTYFEDDTFRYPFQNELTSENIVPAKTDD
jgi:hypothetical protein